MFGAIFLYLALMISFVILRPEVSYTEDGEMKEFGFKNNSTLFPVWVVSILVAVVVGFLYSWVLVL